MHRFTRVLLGLALALSLPSSAPAATVTLNGGTLSLSIGALPPVTVPGSPTSIFVSSGAGTFIEPPFVFGSTTSALSASLFTGLSLISGLTFANLANGTKFCTQPGPPLNCAGGLAGGVFVNILQLFNLTIPLTVVGSPGASVQAAAAGIFITVEGQGWTAGTATVTGISTSTPNGMIATNAFAFGSDNRTTGHGGQLVLVSGFRVLTNVLGNLPGFAVQRLSFAPEPVELLLLGTGLAGFGLYAGWRGRRK